MAGSEGTMDVVVAPDFLSLMAHELAQPLTAALGSVQTIKARTASGDLDEDSHAKLVDIATRNLEQLQALLDSLRVFSEAEAGILEVDRTTVSVEDLFREAQENFGSPWSGTTISCRCDPGLEVKVELMLFRQVLANLVANAYKFSPGGSSISLEAHGTDEDTVLFTVSDQGPGFPPDESERIFERSVRLQAGKRGLGLGLFVAMAIVVAHGGRIWAENIDEGAKFSVVVPAA